jgi:ABC-type multidrug transport system fused ATPase/permease subunit
MAGRGRGQSNDDLPKAKLTIANFKKSFRLFRYVTDNKWLFFAALFFLLGTAAVGLMFPVIAGKMFGFFGETQSPVEQLRIDIQNAGLALLILLVAQGFFSFGRVYMFTRITEKILRGLRLNLFGKLVQLPMSFYSKNKVAELSSRVSTDINVISEAFTVSIAEVVRQTIVGVGGLVILMTLTSWDIAKWFLMIIPPIALVTMIYGRKIRKYSKGYQSKIAESNVVVLEALTGIASVKSFVNEKYEINRYDRITTEIKKFGIKYGIMRGGFFAFIVTCVFGSVFFILYQMLQLKLDNKISPTQFGQFMMLSFFIAGSLGGLPEQLAAIQRALGATDRVFEIIDEEQENLDLDYQTNQHHTRLRGDLEFKNIQFTYPSRKDVVVLKNVTFSAKAGESIAVVGSSGSGKSTLASLTLRFYEPDSGEYLIDGKPSHSYQLTELRDQMSIVPQDVLLFGGTIRENILYGKPSATEEEVIEAAKQANAYHFIMEFPEKFDTVVGDRGIQLSGGQRQRIAIARAVLKNPSILILDEATSSLDSESERLVQEALDKLMVGRTSIVIAHRLSTIKNADKIVVLQKGEIAEIGTHEELVKHEHGIYRHLSELQFGL